MTAFHKDQCALVEGESAQLLQDEITVMTSGAFLSAYVQLARGYAVSSGTRVVTAATRMGSGEDSIPSRLSRGESVDVVIAASQALERLIGMNTVRRDTRVDLARSSIAMAMRAGSVRPDISSLQALKKVFLAARSIACSKSVSGEYLVNELMPHLGIAEAMQSKLRLGGPWTPGEMVARGEAELGIQQKSELLSVDGVEIVGLLPDEAQRVTVLSGGVGCSAKNSNGARRFLRFLTSADAQITIRNCGLEPLQPE